MTLTLDLRVDLYLRSHFESSDTFLSSSSSLFLSLFSFLRILTASVTCLLLPVFSWSLLAVSVKAKPSPVLQRDAMTRKRTKEIVSTELVFIFLWVCQMQICVVMLHAALLYTYCPNTYIITQICNGMVTPPFLKIERHNDIATPVEVSIELESKLCWRTTAPQGAWKLLCCFSPRKPKQLLLLNLQTKSDINTELSWKCKNWANSGS